MYKIDNLDRRVIDFLMKDSSVPLKKLSSKLKKDRRTIKDRIERLKKEKIITSFPTVVDFSKLGFHQVKFYVKLLPEDIKRKEKIVTELKQRKQVVWIANLIGYWDIAFSVLVKDINELLEVTEKLEWDEEVILITRDSLIKEKLRYGKIKEIRKLSDEEKKILSVLRSNSRLKIVNIAKKVNMSVERTLYWLKKLKKDKIIIGGDIVLDWKRTFRYFKILMYGGEIPETGKYKNIKQWLKLEGPWNSEIEVLGDYRELIDDLRQSPKIAKRLEVLEIEKEHTLSYVPF